MCVIFLAKHVFNIGREWLTLSKGLWLWYHIKVTWALLILKRHFKGRGLLKAYKAHNPNKPWQCRTLNSTDLYDIFYWFHIFILINNIFVQKLRDQIKTSYPGPGKKQMSHIRKSPIKIQFQIHDSMNVVHQVACAGSLPPATMVSSAGPYRN
jgi:hypothetical protein